MNIPQSSLRDVVKAVRKSCYHRTGQSLEDLLYEMGWALQDYRFALIEQPEELSPCKATVEGDRMDP